MHDRRPARAPDRGRTAHPAARRRAVQPGRVDRPAL